MSELNLKELASLVVSKKNNENKPSKGDKIDRILTNQFLGLIIFALIMFLVFFISQTGTAFITENFITAPLEGLNESLKEWFDGNGTSVILSGLICDGVFAGFIAIIGFLPLIMVLFFLLSLLEDSGYMSRVSLVIDNIFRKVGLSGKSIIPFYMGTACGVPGVMATRTIKNSKQRRITAMLTPFIPCGAKLPVIALFFGVYFTDVWYGSALIYLLAFVVILLAAFIIKIITNTQYTNVEETYLIIELPDYKAPSLKNATLNMLDRAKTFIIKAGTIIVVFNAVVWFLTNFNFSFEFVDGEITESMLHTITSPIAGLVAPLGITGAMAWGFVAAAIVGLIAKENIIAALVIIFGLSGAISNDEVVNANEVRELLGITTASGIAFLLFNLFIPPCFAAIGAMKTELNSLKWTLFAVMFQLVIGFVISIAAYQILSLAIDHEVGKNLVLGLSIIATAVVGIIVMAIMAKKGKWLARI